MKTIYLDNSATTKPVRRGDCRDDGRAGKWLLQPVGAVPPGHGCGESRRECRSEICLKAAGAANQRHGVHLWRHGERTISPFWAFAHEA